MRWPLSIAGAMDSSLSRVEKYLGFVRLRRSPPPGLPKQASLSAYLHHERARETYRRTGAAIDA